MRALREALGPKAKLMVDLHWKFTAAEAIQLIGELAPYRPYFAEAPCQPEDLEGLAHVAAQTSVPIAAGEEWRTVYEALPRFERRSVIGHPAGDGAHRRDAVPGDRPAGASPSMHG